MNIIGEIEREMYPIEIRFGIGIGRITTNINKKMALGADGPGYHKARNAIEYLKENEKRKQAVAADIRLEVESDNQSTTLMINTILELMTAIKTSWSSRQRELIWDMFKHQDSQIDNIEKALSEIRRDDV